EGGAGEHRDEHCPPAMSHQRDSLLGGLSGARSAAPTKEREPMKNSVFGMMAAMALMSVGCGGMEQETSTAAFGPHVAASGSRARTTRRPTSAAPIGPFGPQAEPVTIEQPASTELCDGDVLVLQATPHLPTPSDYAYTWESSAFNVLAEGMDVKVRLTL